MKKNILLGMLALGLVCVGYVIGTSQVNVPTVDDQNEIEDSMDVYGQSFVFTTQEGDSFSIRYTADAAQAELSYSGLTYVLNRAVSGSGSRYTTTDESVEYWEHAGQATVTIAGAVVAVGTREAAGTESVSVPETLLGRWVWHSTTYQDSGEVVPKRVDAFTLTFSKDSTVTVTTDCNGGSGTVTVGSDGTFVIANLASTLMGCMGETQERQFYQMLGSVQSYTETADNSLVLQMSNPVGTMTFLRVE